MEFIKNLWVKMNETIDNIHSEKKISPNDFLWKIQKWAYFGELWNPKPMNYCPYYWMGVFTTIMTFIIPIIPLGHMFYYIGLGLKFLGIKFWKYFVISVKFIIVVIKFIFSPMMKLSNYLGNKLDNWLESIVAPIKEHKVEKRKIKISKQKINDKILYYLLEYDYFDYDYDSGQKNPNEIAKDYLNELIIKSNVRNPYKYEYTSNYINEPLYKSLDKLDGWDDDRRAIRKKNRQYVQSWIDNNPNWEKQFKSYIKPKFNIFKRVCEWERVKDEFEYKGSKGLGLEKFKEFKTELTDLEKLKRRNKIVNKAIAFTKVFAKVLLGFVALAVVGLGVWGLTFVTTEGWVESGIISLWITGVCVVVLGLFTGIRYLIQDTKFSENCGKFFGAIWKVITVVFLPITFIFKMIARKVSMLLDWKKENCPHIVYEGFEDE